MSKLRFLVVGCLFAAVGFATAPQSGAHNPPIPEVSGFTRYEHAFMDTLTPSARVKAAATTAVTCIAGMAGPFPCKDVDLMAYLDTNSAAGITGSDIEGWTDPVTGKEWAIQGHSDATTFVDVTNPEAPVICCTLPPAMPSVLWRELEVYNNHLYVVQDLVGQGLQIFDLTKLRGTPPAPPPPVFGPTDYTRDTSFGNAHTITINNDTGFAYVQGSNTCSAGPRVFDLKPNPKVPVFVGCINGDGYTHDSQCVVYHGPDTAYTGHEICAMYNEDTLTIYDATVKGTPNFGVMLSRNCYSTAPAGGKYTHQGWFTEDHRYILLDDELDEDGSALVFTTTYLWDMTDLDDAANLPPPANKCSASNDAVGPRLIAPYRHATKCTDHNQFIIGRFAYQSNYACGLRVMDVTDVAAGQLKQAAYFDTAPAHDFIPGASDGGDLDGDWANYPYFSSGTVVTSNISKGLFVLRPHLPSVTGPFARCEDLGSQPIFCDDLEPAPLAGWAMSHSFDCDVAGKPAPCVGATNQPLPGNCAADEWHVTTDESHSATHAFTNFPYTQAFQADHCRNDLMTPAITIPGNMSSLTLSFWEHRYTEGQDQRYGNPCNAPTNDPPTCDYGEVQWCEEPGCTDPSATWLTLSNRYEGGLPGDSYGEKAVALGPLAGKTIRLRFRFNADALAAAPPQGPFLGWFIDDIVVSGVRPTAVTVASFTATASRGTGVEVAWRTASEVDAAGFNVWRLASGGRAVKVNRSLIAAKARGTAAGATYRLVDSRVRPGVKYTYRLQSVSRDGGRTWQASAAVRVKRSS